MNRVTSDTARGSIHVEKRFNAPIDRVWQVWTRPEEIAYWWGPSGFTSTIHQMEVTEGGEWRLTMQGPDGKHYPNKSRYLEVVPLQKIVFQHFNPGYTATVLFKAREGGTLLDWTMVFETPELFETVVKVFKADEGLQQNVEKLEHYLEQKLQDP
ncbi:SRPBCC domain-containing protein [Niabella drilacis]|uniref:Uncharacterized conserved protein YndB, AHSA1/START domain n=1 Tax=Niabella drilacis (strain DSM 25811 / CCM 8410 / CCUG 62505 / LMG 26954 / E90) TaxID=1285928 RepID=A0A1G6HZ06_NIADE|nr:SRPBCC domain-containing protein [Niabella drilacis]SDB99451.1 Uncharacterized conserved protein YndB, AHSA1/START domain [Niabella drilacis]